MKDSDTVAQGCKLFLQDLIEKLSIMMTVVFKVECLRSKKRSFNHFIHIGYLSEQFCGVMSAVKINLVHSNFLCCSCRVKNEVAAFN